MIRLPLLLLLLNGCDKPGGTPVKPPEYLETDEDADGHSPEEGDCDDHNPAINPGLDEQCNGYDDNCDGLVDDGLLLIFYADTDGDGAGDPDSPTEACTLPEGFQSSSDDCDDENAARYPSNPEICDALDNDCDEVVDEDVTTRFYQDDDGDTFGTDAYVDACAVPEGYAPDTGDCDDLEVRAYPGNIEVCDGLDNNCDGETDELLLTNFYADTDGDGYGDPAAVQSTCVAAVGHTTDSSDCDDTTPLINPSVDEQCNDFDDNCDGIVDDAAVDRLSWYPDADGDSFGDTSGALLACDQPVGYTLDNSDCDDAASTIYPRAPELCNALDDNCDGVTDLDAIDRPYWYADLDGDGYGATASALSCEQPAGTSAYDGDCDDTDPSLSPAATELCDRVDNDCDGVTDEDDAADAATWYYDLDNDGYGDPGYSSVSCSPGPAQTADSSDCDDGQPSANPSEIEYCDGFDNDCDGDLDEVDAADAPTWYLDLDSDGFGLTVTATNACDQPIGYVTDSGDCDDNWDTAYPGGTEVCDEHDNDCDLSTDESSAIDAATWYSDDDGDTYGSPTTSVRQCDAPRDYVLDGTDCDDSASTINPGEAEVCNDIDDNCDGGIDTRAVDVITWYADDDGDGQGDPVTTRVQCDQPAGYLSVAGDCNDAVATIYTGAPERCDTVDQDCDGQVADADASDATLWYDDADGDGYGVAGTGVVACFAPADTSANDDDCDDTMDTVYLGSHEPEASNDGVDTDCDGNDDCDDLNCDGWPDIVFANYNNGLYDINSHVYYGSSASFAGAVPLELPTLGARQAHVQDLNQDGYLDVLFVNERSDTSFEVVSTIYWGSVSGLSATSFTDLATNGAREVCVDDLDADGELDLVFAHHEDDTTFETPSVIYWGDSSSSYSSSTSLVTTGATSCAIGDVDDDGFLDVAFGADEKAASAAYNLGAVFWGSGGGTYGMIYDTLVTHDVFAVRTVDFLRDGENELVWLAGYDGDYDVEGFSLSGTGQDLTVDAEYFRSYGGVDIATADLNLDDREDVVVAGYQSGTSDWTNLIPIYFTSVNGEFLSESAGDYVDVLGARSVILVDLNADTALDVVFANERSSASAVDINSYIYWNRCVTSTSTNCFENTTSGRTLLPTRGATGVAASDLNGDGYSDLVFSNGSIGTDSTIYWGTGAGYLVARRTALPTESPESDPVIVGTLP